MAVVAVRLAPNPYRSTSSDRPGSRRRRSHRDPPVDGCCRWGTALAWVRSVTGGSMASTAQLEANRANAQRSTALALRRGRRGRRRTPSGTASPGGCWWVCSTGRSRTMRQLLRGSSTRCWRSLPRSPRRNELRRLTSPGCTCAGAAWSSWRPWRCLTALRQGCCRRRAPEGRRGSVRHHL